jgi:hypothetical protein
MSEGNSRKVIDFFTRKPRDTGNQSEGAEEKGVVPAPPREVVTSSVVGGEGMTTETADVVGKVISGLFRRSEPIRRDWGVSLRFANVALGLEELSRQDPRACNPNNIRIRREMVKEDTDEEIIRKLENSTARDWRAHPSYYYALLAEARSRNLE